MNYQYIINEHSRNKNVFKGLLSGLTEELYLWRPGSDKWCLLEIICHLYDEEQEDFKARTKQVLSTPELALPPINPTEWVLGRSYIKQDYLTSLSKFISEREQSILWLQSLKNPKWDNAFHHPKFGKMTAMLFLSNWLAHDYIHIRQIITLKFNYLKQHANEPLDYAGNW